MFSPTPFKERHADPLKELIVNPERNGKKLVLTNNTLWGKNTFPNVRLRFLMRPLHIRLHEPRFVKIQPFSIYCVRFRTNMRDIDHWEIIN